jgi:hypothetical protein
VLLPPAVFDASTASWIVGGVIARGGQLAGECTQ